MSTSYRLETDSYRLATDIRAQDVFDGRLGKFGVREQLTSVTTATRKCLTDGRDYLWVSIDDAGLVDIRIGIPTGKILNAIEDAFDNDIVWEYEPQFWDFNTEDELDAFKARKFRTPEEFDAWKRRRQIRLVVSNR